MDKDIFYKDFTEAPDDWDDELFGPFVEQRIIKCLVPPSMKSANDKQKVNYRMAHIAVSKEPLDRLALEGDLRRIVAWGCTCSYKAGSIGRFTFKKSFLFIVKIRFIKLYFFYF